MSTAFTTIQPAVAGGKIGNPDTRQEPGLSFAKQSSAGPAHGSWWWARRKTASSKAEVRSALIGGSKARREPQGEPMRLP
jgi:hypothetical protein